MKTLFSFLFVFLFVFGFGQRNYTTYEKRQELYQENYKALMAESKSIDLKKLDKIILKNIDEKKLKKDNLVFIIEDLDVKIFPFEIDAYEYVPSKAINPYFNQSTFWTRKNIKYLVDKLKKNIIPYKGGYEYGFIDSIQLKNLDNKIFAKELSNQKIGKYLQEKDGKISEKVFLYFPYDDENLELKSIEKENINFDTINIKFRNFQGKIVSFKIIYNADRENTVTKTYQYQNKTWIEIPTKEEYEF